MTLTIAEYFDRLATQGLGIENVEEEFLDRPAWEEEE